MQTCCLKFKGKDKSSTNLYGGDAEAARLEEDSYTASRHPFAQSAHHSSSHQHVLHLLSARNLGQSKEREQDDEAKSTNERADSRTPCSSLASLPRSRKWEAKTIRLSGGLNSKYPLATKNPGLPKKKSN